MTINFEGIREEITSDKKLFVYSVNYKDLMNSSAQLLFEKVIDKAAETIAEEFIKNNMQDILKKLDIQTVLNLALAKSAAKVFAPITKE